MTDAPSEHPDELARLHEAHRTVVLMGAGASADVGLPTASQLHLILLESLPPLYSRLSNLVFPSGEVDVERLFRVIQFVHAVETRGRPRDQVQTHEALDLVALVDRWAPDLQGYLDTQAAAIAGSPTRRLIEELWAVLDQELTTSTLGDELNHLCRLLFAMRGTHEIPGALLVTLNYDNSVNMAASVSGVPVDSGPRPSFLPPIGKAPLRLVKLHGSLSWTRNAVTGQVIEQESAQLARQLLAQEYGYQEPAIIFGAGNKLRPDGPYLDLLREFEAGLEQANRLIVIGYSFRDAHVNALLTRWTSTPDRQAQSPRGGAKLLRIGRHSRSGLPAEILPQGAPPHLEVQVIVGRARDTIEDLIASRSRLERA